ncbi:M23 family metallopeptidase [Bifidobacterium sp. ESL0769]|uniref:M23 family metallopeptidase n=1 Tax=Bifidobacterium sp. ESL0769 TaxID=2983229 RepID=UPI0023F86E3A|nr:M23 family metallopeptidase [Bifidobacterium sp. ESL0769]WEV68331.1 M23 family metallopeptidase [Bifidobacterium sp. ESL0769]
MMDNREKQRLKRERLRRQREERRQKLISLVWGLVTILAVCAVLFVGFGISDHEALAATNGTSGNAFDVTTVPSLNTGEAHKSASSLRQSQLGFIEPIESVNPPMHSDKGCKADMRWPVLPHVVIRKFKAPKQVWGPGHRGVDVAAVEDTPLLAPASGYISFVGIVAGKSVVSIRHKSLTLTLEPAQTLLPIGMPVVKGMPIGTMKGVSDHCTGICVHWGVRKSRKEYRDPQQLASRRKIVLKPVSS